MATNAADIKTEDGSCVDGRVLRGQRNREAIVDALLDIYACGNLRPTAGQVAEAAGLSTRSVYHHFDDMKSLILEVAERSEQRVSSPDYEALGTLPLDERICRYTKHRFDRWSVTAAVMRAGLLAEYDSKVVAELMQVSRRKRLDELRAVFGEDIGRTDDPVATVGGLDVVLGFEMWNRLIRMRRLGRDRATRIVTKLVAALL